MQRRLYSIASVGVLLLAFSGCLRRETEEVVALDWWITYAPESAEYAAFQALADAYAATTGYVIDLVSVPWDEIAPRGFGGNMLVDAQESGTGPDLWGPVPHTWTGVFATKGQALALEATQIEDAGQYLEAAMQACRYDGKQYALPVLIDSVSLIGDIALCAVGRTEIGVGFLYAFFIRNNFYAAVFLVGFESSLRAYNLYFLVRGG